MLEWLVLRLILCECGGIRFDLDFINVYFGGFFLLRRLLDDGIFVVIDVDFRG